MRKFENGERDFKRGDMVFVVTPDDYKVRFGIIDEYAGHGFYHVDYVGLKDCRLIDGVPIDEIDLSRVYKLPKKWSYDTQLFEQTYSPDHKRITDYLRHTTDDKLAYAYKNGDLVKLKNRFNGYISTDVDKSTYTLKRVYSDDIKKSDKIPRNHIFLSSISATTCAKIIKDKIERDNRYLAEMTDEDYSWYEINRVFERAGLRPDEKAEICAKIATMKELKPIEDLESRVFNGKIQFTTKDGKWADVFSLAVEEKPQPKEKYCVHVTLVYDLDEPIVYMGYTDDDPAEIHRKYADFREYRLTIGCTEWTLDRGPEIPAFYEGGIKRDESGELIPALIAHYRTKNGEFTVIDGKIWYCNLTFGKKYSILYDKIHVYGSSSRSDAEIIELVAKKARQEMGGWGDKIAEVIRDFPVEKS